jgi:hypothetical protein
VLRAQVPDVVARAAQQVGAAAELLVLELLVPFQPDTRCGDEFLGDRAPTLARRSGDDDLWPPAGKLEQEVDEPP